MSGNAKEEEEDVDDLVAPEEALFAAADVSPIEGGM